MNNLQWMRDPTPETSPLKRARLAPPKSLDGLTVGLFDIGKTQMWECEPLIPLLPEGLLRSWATSI